MTQHKIRSKFRKFYANQGRFLFNFRILFFPVFFFGNWKVFKVRLKPDLFQELQRSNFAVRRRNVQVQNSWESGRPFTCHWNRWRFTFKIHHWKSPDECSSWRRRAWRSGRRRGGRRRRMEAGQLLRSAEQFAELDSRILYEMFGQMPRHQQERASGQMHRAPGHKMLHEVDGRGSQSAQDGSLWPGMHPAAGTAKIHEQDLSSYGLVLRIDQTILDAYHSPNRQALLQNPQERQSLPRCGLDSGRGAVAGDLRDPLEAPVHRQHAKFEVFDRNLPMHRRGWRILDLPVWSSRASHQTAGTPAPKLLLHSFPVDRSPSPGFGQNVHSGAADATVRECEWWRRRCGIRRPGWSRRK